MNISQVDARKFSDISIDGNVDLSDYVINSGNTEDGLNYAEFCTSRMETARPVSSNGSLQVRR